MKRTSSLLQLLLALLLLTMQSSSERISVIGGGNWGTAMARHLAKENKNEEPVKMWVFEEVVQGQNLTDMINSSGMNSKYLPNVKLPLNLKASCDITEVCQGADVIFLAIPHQFIHRVLQTMVGHVNKDTVVCSLTKGLLVDERGPQLISSMIRDVLDLDTEVAVLCGANVARDVACDEFVEASVACRDLDIACQVKRLVHSKRFEIDFLTTDVSSVELSGALKNVVALGAGFCDGLGVGPSTKAAIIRKGMQDMATFCGLYTEHGVQVDTILSSCFVGDVIATSFGGRNRKCAQEYARKMVEIVDEEKEEGVTGGSGGIGKVRAAKLWADIEIELLDGQKLQGLSTCDEVIACLHSQETDRLKQYVIFPSLYDIAIEGRDVRTLLE